MDVFQVICHFKCAEMLRQEMRPFDDKVGKYPGKVPCTLQKCAHPKHPNPILCPVCLTVWLTCAVRSSALLM